MGNTQIHVSVTFDGERDATSVFVDLILRKYVFTTVSCSGQQDKMCYTTTGESNIVSNGLDGNEP